MPVENQYQPKRRKSQPTWLRLSSMGFELAAAMAGFGLVGAWVDRHWEVGPWGTLIGVLLGVIGGMYNLIRESLTVSRNQSSPKDGGET